MKQKTKNILFWISALGAAVICIFVILYQYLNPELTTTKIAINTWPLYIPLFLCAYGLHKSLN